MKPYAFTEVHDRIRYSTTTATLLAGNDYWDGHNYERGGTNTFLYRTPRGRYFAFRRTLWEGKRDYIEPLTEDDAIRLYEDLREKRVEFEDAFPGVAVQEG